MASPVAVPRAMTELRAAARAASPDGLIDLSRSEPLPIPPPDACAARVQEEFGRARLYSPPGGIGAVREAIARRAAAATGLDLGPGDAIATPGAMAGVSIALRALAPPGSEVLVPVPYFHSYPKQVAMLGASARLVDTTATRGELTPDAVERELSERTSALLLCNPGNPSGVVLDRDRIAAILAVLPPEVAVIGDEVYCEFLYGGELTSVLAVAAAEDRGREVVVLDTASKTAAMPGWRVGSAVGTAGLVPRLASAAATLSGPPSVLTQIAYAAWLDDPPQLDRMAPYRPRLRDALDGLAAGGLDVREPQGTYYVWAGADDEIGAPERVLEAARATGTLVWPGILFGDSRSVRISLSVPRGDLRDGVRRVTDSMEGGPAGDVPISRSGG